MTLRGRLLAFNLGQILALGLVFAAGAVFTRQTVLPMLEEHLISKTAHAARELANEMDVPVASDDRPALLRVVADFVGDPDFAGLRVTGRSGQVVFERGALPRDLLEAPRDVVTSRGGHLAAWAPVAFEGVDLGRVEVAVSRARVERVSRILLALGGIAAAALIAASLLSSRFASAFVRPIGRMMAFSRRVAEGKLDERMQSGAVGELAELVRYMNTMTAALQSREASLAQRSAELEASLAKLRHAQEELLKSTRLASVGEMAGRTAHEVLNPVTSIHGRVSRLDEYEETTGAANRDTLDAIVSGWESTYAREGMAGLALALEARTPDASGKARPLIEEDLENLRGLHRVLAAKSEGDRRDFAFLLGQVDRIVHIIDGMRSLTRQRGTAANLGVRGIVDEAVEIARDSARKRNIMLEVTGEDAPVYVDRYEMIQVLTNLLRNAMQAIEDKSGRAGGRISVRVSAKGQAVFVRVDDTGTGIQSDHLPFIFESGFTTRAAGDGTGLGLAISRRLARGFRGELTLEESRPGEGCTFLLQLPRVFPGQSEAEGAEAIDAAQ